MAAWTPNYEITPWTDDDEEEEEVVVAKPYSSRPMTPGTYVATGPGVYRRTTGNNGLKPNPKPKPKNTPVEEVNVNSGNTSLVETLLLLLIIVNGFTSGQFKGLWGIITLQNTANFQQIRQGFMVLGGELVALIILSLVAKSGDTAKKVVLFLVGALWLGWFIHNQQTIASFTAKVQPGKTIKPGGKLTKA